jgi:hypothetical protein
MCSLRSPLTAFTTHDYIPSRPHPLTNSLPCAVRPIPCTACHLGVLCSSSRRNKAFLTKCEKRRPFTVHVRGGPYESRYLLHAFTGYEVAACPAAPAWSFGEKSQHDWLVSTSVAPGPGNGEKPGRREGDKVVECSIGISGGWATLFIIGPVCSPFRHPSLFAVLSCVLDPCTSCPPCPTARTAPTTSNVPFGLALQGPTTSQPSQAGHGHSALPPSSAKRVNASRLHRSTRYGSQAASPDQVPTTSSHPGSRPQS